MNIDDKIQRFIPRFRVEAFVSILSEITDYNHRLMNIPEMWKTTRGAKVKIAVLDTGAPNHIDIKLAGSHSTISGYLEDKCGHATHCCGIIGAVADNGMGVKGIAPDADMYACAVLDGNGTGTAKNIAHGVRFATDVWGVDIISMSLGMPSSPTSYELKLACDYAMNKGVTIIAAAGNEAGKVGQPAKYDGVIAVAAVDEDRNHAPFSNFGNQVDFSAGGVNVYSTYLNNGYAKLSGTSMATPALAGVAALIISDAKLGDNPRRLTPAEVKYKLNKIAFDIGPKGWDAQFGYGIPVFGHTNPEPMTEPVAGPAKPSCFAKYLARICGVTSTTADRLEVIGSDILKAASILRK